VSHLQLPLFIQRLNQQQLLGVINQTIKLQVKNRLELKSIPNSNQIIHLTNIHIQYLIDQRISIENKIKQIEAAEALFLLSVKTESNQSN
jgi:hypothetical protein